MTKVILIRHGQTNYNRQKRYCGSSDISINKTGILEAGAVSHKLNGLGVGKVFCSDLKRSLQTARIIFPDIKDVVMSGSLREINFGAWEGLTYRQILKKNPRIYRKWLDDPFCVDIPNGERMVDFVRRVREGFRTIVKNNASATLALVSHLGPMRVILNSLNRDSDRFFSKNGRCPFWNMHIEPRNIYIIEYSGVLAPKVLVR